VTEKTFEKLLAELIRGAIESGMDVFNIHRALATAGMQMIDECRCDLSLYDEGDGEPPF
jgi:hypothetical protein